MWMEHMNFIQYMVARGLGLISTTKHVILPDALVSNTLYSQKTQTMNGLMVHFWNIGTFTGHSISFVVDNGTLDGGLNARLIKNLSVRNTYMSFKKTQ